MAVGRNGTDGLLTDKVIQVKTRAAVEGEKKSCKWKGKQQDLAVDATSKGQRYIKLSPWFGVWMSEKD